MFEVPQDLQGRLAGAVGSLRQDLGERYGGAKMPGLDDELKRPTPGSDTIPSSSLSSL